MAQISQPARAATSPAAHQPATAAQEQITVWGHRRHFFPAPMANTTVAEPGPRSGFGPGARLGIATVEGGPASDRIHNGVSAGIAIPVSGVRGLDFTLTATGSRDSMAASGTNGAAATTAGLRLKF
ncbi:hypothetical protein [Lichenicoccus sp.]|uniref:hypothetical protein n=1 Tax=Lichenicoccus sp. TaxID=2781899 RepID=UPI003D0F37B1